MKALSIKKIWRALASVKTEIRTVNIRISVNPQAKQSETRDKQIKSIRIERKQKGVLF